MRKALPILLVFGVAAFLLLAHLGAPPLDEAEARSAIVSRHILITGQWLCPVPNRPFVCEASPLVYWQTLPFALLTGRVSELAVRLPAVLWALALLFLTWALARRWHGGPTALLSAGVLATSYGFLHWGRHGTAEMAQAATILWCLWHFVKHRGDAGRRWLLVFGLLVGLAASFGAREAYGVVILGALALSAMAKDWSWLRPARTVALAAILSVAVFLALPLTAAVATGSSEPLRALWREHVLRHLQPPGQAFGWHRDLWRLIAFSAPWVVLLPIDLLSGFWQWRRKGVPFPRATLLAGVAAGWLLLSSSVEPRSVLPAIPLLSIASAGLVARSLRRESAGAASWAIRTLAILMGLSLIGQSTSLLHFAGVARGWEPDIVTAVAGLAMVFGSVARRRTLVPVAAAALWFAYIASALPGTHEAVREQVAKVAARGKPVAFLGAVPAPVVFYLNAGYALLDGPVEAEKWAVDTAGTLIASAKPEGDSWQSVADGRSWRALVWNPKAKAVALTRDPAWLAKHPLRGIKSESLTYVFSAESGIRFNLGTVTMKLAREDTRNGREVVITAESKGGVPGYPMASVVTSRLRDSDLAQIEADDFRTKPSFKHRRFTWLPEGVDYHRHDHCKDPNCRNPLHMVTQRDGTKVHCNGKHCTNPDHREWRLKEAFRAPGARDSWHVIAACYIARGFDATPGAPPQVIRVINNQCMWDVALRGAEERAITVPAGKFDCLKLAFDATPVNKEAKENADEAEGPFGLTGHVDLYVDKATKLLVLLDGEIELGATFKVQVMLTKREAEAQ